MTHLTHVPFQHHVLDSDTIVLFIHGILESPNQFKEMASLAESLKLSTHALLLPGHGGSGETFAAATKNDWMNHVEDTLTTLRLTYTNIILVGHSMGTLLAYEAYASNRVQIIGIVALASPLHIRCTPRGAWCGLKVAFDRVNARDFYTLSMAKSYSVKNEHILTYLKWIPRYIDLFKLMALGRKSICNLKVPLLFVHCYGDEFVSMRSLKRIKSNVTLQEVSIVELKKSGHFYYEETDLVKLHHAYVDFLKHVIKKAD